MTRTFDLIVRGGEVANHAGRGPADVGVIDGRIAFIGDLSQASAGETFDAAGLTVLPGVIDTQVHFREPGLEWKEDLETGSRAAALGGVTAVFEMPNTEPNTTDPDTLQDKLDRARGRMWTDHAFYIGATRGWGWEWWQALLLVAPYLVVSVVALVVTGSMSLLDGLRRPRY